MKIEIWSDILCPFCYIGKRHFERALAEFPQRDTVTVEWKSYELSPDAPEIYDGTIYELLAKKYNTSLKEAKQMNARVVEMAAATGLNYDMDNMKPTNSFNAHRLIHLANTFGLQDKAEELLFKACFINGQNIGNKDVLKNIGIELGLETGKIDQLLSTDEFSMDVRKEEEEASKLGIRGVPFFVFDRKYAVSGAQPVNVFLDTLNKAYSEK